MKFGEQPTFKKDLWQRPAGPDDMLNYEGYIDRWDSKEKVWYMPVDYVNFPD